MPARTAGPVVAILNSDAALLALLQETFQRAGFRTLTALLADFPTQAALLAFLQAADVRVIVYDIPPPYEAGWVAYHRFAQAAEAFDLLVIVTSASPLALPPQAGATEIVQLSPDRAALEYTVVAVRALLADEAENGHPEG